MSILILPGFLKSKKSYLKLLDRLKVYGFDGEVLDLGYNIQSLEKGINKLTRYLKENSIKHDIIAHSFGGIILKCTLLKEPSLVKYLNTISFVAVPHGGSWQALFLLMFPAARDLLPLKKHFRNLDTLELPEATMNFIAEKDFKIFPKKSGLLKSHIDVVISDVNHDNILNNDDFIAKVSEFIKSYHDRISL